jgi:CO/xanthine dehydrogenase FAD-binding subunit
MITTYHRPHNLEQVLALTTRHHPKTLVMSGGTFLSHSQLESAEVVDLQALGLNQINKIGKSLEIGATTTLQQLFEFDDFPNAFRPAIKLEAPLNIRNTASVAGTIVVSDGRSTFTTTLMALDAKCIIQPNDQEILIGNLLPFRDRLLQGKVITKIIIPVNIKAAFHFISRTPSDKPIVCTAFAQWPSGRTRLAIGGYGKTPLLAMDGTETTGLETAARNVLEEANDSFASAEYRTEVASTLAKRCLATINIANQ